MSDVSSFLLAGNIIVWAAIAAYLAYLFLKTRELENRVNQMEVLKDGQD